MINLSSNPLLQQAYEVIQSIEKCGASTELTTAVTKASELLTAIDEFIKTRELKGDQVPVGFAVMDENHDWHIDFCGKEHALSHGDSLFTAPQKQVVLPEAYDDGDGNEWLSRKATIAAIEAAGGVVKEGE